MSERSAQTLPARLGGMTFAVKLFKSVSDAKDVTFDKAGPHGGALVNHVVEEGVPGTPGRPAVVELREEDHPDAPVTREDVRQGVMTEQGFVDLTEHLSRIDEEEALEEMEILGFVRREQLPLERVLGSYWLAPGDGTSAKVLRLIWVASRVRHRSAVVTWTKKTNRALGLLVPHASGGMLLTELAFPERSREIPPAVVVTSTIEVTADEVNAADSLIVAMSESPDLLSEVTDDRRARRTELYEAVKEAGKAPALPVAEEAEEALPEAAAFAAALS